MSAETYASLPDTVLAYKKTHQIGRFDPHATENVETKVANLWREVAAGGKIAQVCKLSGLSSPLSVSKSVLRSLCVRLRGTRESHFALHIPRLSSRYLSVMPLTWACETLESRL